MMNTISKQKIRLFPILLLLIALLPACSFLPASTNVSPAKEQIIFFSTNKQGDRYITTVYSMNPDGSGLARLVEVPTNQAILSPDGQKLAFKSSDFPDGGIHTINLDGSGQKKLTNLENKRISSDPVWSLDSQYMAFIVSDGVYYTIYTVHADGSQLKPLDNGSNEGPMSWSPDGLQIAFGYSRGERSSSGIKIVNFDGSNAYDIVNPNDMAFCEDYKNCLGSGGPIWSPDGRKIVFTSNLDAKPGIYVVNVNESSNRIKITSLLNDDVYRYIWSPDGKRIAFVSKRDGHFNIYLAMADGSGEIRLTNNISDNHYPFWSPDGEKIVFGSNRDGNWRIYIMNNDGSNQTALTTNETDNYYGPVWQPQPKP